MLRFRITQRSSTSHAYKCCCGRGLVIVGSPRTLCADAVWQKWLSWVRQQGCVSSAASVQRAMQQIP